MLEPLEGCGGTSALRPALRAVCFDQMTLPWVGGSSRLPQGTLAGGGPVGSHCPEPLLSCCFPAVVRKLQEFELPYVSVTSLHNPEFRIILRKR